MKTKLLKKVRKQYSILEITKLFSHPCGDLIQAKKRLGLPFFVLLNNEDDIYVSCSKNIDDLIKIILSITRSKYQTKVNMKTTKVWYNTSKNNLDI